MLDGLPCHSSHTHMNLMNFHTVTYIFVASRCFVKPLQISRIRFCHIVNTAHVSQVELNLWPRQRRERASERDTRVSQHLNLTDKRGMWSDVLLHPQRQVLVHDGVLVWVQFPHLLPFIYLFLLVMLHSWIQWKHIRLYKGCRCHHVVSEVLTEL